MLGTNPSFRPRVAAFDRGVPLWDSSDHQYRDAIHLGADRFPARPPGSAWRDIPIWYPPTGDHKGNGLISPTRAIAAGLTYRAVADTARDPLVRYQSLGTDWETDPNRRSLSASKETELLAAWKARQSP
jgi:hypothetical protein